MKILCRLSIIAPTPSRGPRGFGGSWSRGSGARGPGARGPRARGPRFRGPGARGPGARGPRAGRPGSVDRLNVFIKSAYWNSECKQWCNNLEYVYTS